MFDLVEFEDDIGAIRVRRRKIGNMVLAINVFIKAF